MVIAPLALATLAVSASAQAVDKPYYLKGGIVYPSNKSTRDATGDTGFTIGAGYQLGTPSLLGTTGGTPAVEVNFARNKSGDDKLENLSLYYKERYRQPGQSGVYFGWGAGINFLDASVVSPVAAPPLLDESIEEGAISPFASVDTGVTEKNSGSKTTLGLNALVGFDLSDTTFIELGYTMAGKVQGRRADSIDVTIGVKF